MGEGGNLLIIMFSINIVLYIGLTGIDSNMGNIVQDDLFNGDANLLTLDGDRVGLSDDMKEKPELTSSNILSEVLSFKVYDVITIVWDFLMTILNIITLPLTLMYNLFASARVVGRIMSLLIFAPLSIAYIYAIISFIKGVGN